MVHTQGEICIPGGLFLRTHQEVAVETLKGLNTSRPVIVLEVPGGLWTQTGGIVILHPSPASSVTLGNLFNFSVPHCPNFFF